MSEDGSSNADAISVVSERSSTDIKNVLPRFWHRPKKPPKSQIRFIFSNLIKDADSDLMVPGASYREISEYIEKDDVVGLKVFLESKSFNMEDRNEEGLSSLHLAASRGSGEIVGLLIRHSGDVNAEDFQKCTPLHWASREGHYKVCLDLIDAGSSLNQTDMGLWTPFMWACYNGHTTTANTLISKGCDIHLRGAQQVSALNWAAGRGHEDVVRLLLEKNMKPDLGDKYGTTALIWASRKGYTNIVKLLLRYGASVDSVGMYSWTPLLVGAKGNYTQVVDLLMEKNPNVNKVDKDGLTALAIACKEGFQEIVFKLISYGAFVNLQDKSGDTNLILASKGGYKAIVDILIKKHADVNMRGKDNKTCLHWAIDKNHTSIVKSILNVNPDLEIRTVDGDTALLRAVKFRNEEVVQMLLDKKAKISTIDSKHDTALHIAMRARSKAIVEILLRNPKHSQLLYRPNRAGETPYSIDVNSHKTILGQVFGARRLNTNEDGEKMLGYDLYSSSLADILTEPTLSTPITVGLYAKWGSGKSFLLRKLREEMKSFTREWVDPSFHNSPLLFAIIFHVAAIIGVISLISFYSASSLGSASGFIGLIAAAIIFIASYIFVFAVRQGSYRFDWHSFNISIATKFNAFRLILQVMFCHPPGPDFVNSEAEIKPLRLLFTEQTKVITSSGGQNSVTQMIGSLYDSIEVQYGKYASRLFRAFRPAPIKNSSPIRWKKLCCVPYVFIYFICFFCALAGFVLISVELKYRSTPNKVLITSVSHPIAPTKPTFATENSFDEDDDNEEDFDIDTFPIQESISDDDFLEEKLILGCLITLGVILTVVIVANLSIIGRCIYAIIFSQREHLQRTVAKLDLIKSEGYLQAVKGEVQLLLEMVQCLDAFTGQQSRMVVVVDGLDSCEQAKVLSVLDAVHMLFSDRGSPFIIILAIDPHVITKAIELNLNRAFSDTSIGGNAYLRNVVHLPFFLQNSGLRKVKVAQKVASKFKNVLCSAINEDMDRRNSIESMPGIKTGGKSIKSSKSRLRKADSIASSIGSRVVSNTGEPSDLTKILLTDDYFSDVNPRSLRRLMNVIYVMGRLLKAFHIDFNWHRLSSWVNITEQWPYHTSWITIFVELNEDTVDDFTPLKIIYDKIKAIIPTQKELEPLLEMDRDEKKFETFLSLHKKNLAVLDVKIFLPFTINLDPYLRKIIKDEIQNMEEMGIQVPSLEGSRTDLSSNPSTTGLTRRQATELSRKMSHSDMTSIRTKASSFPIYPPIPGYLPPPQVQSQNLFDIYPKPVHKAPSLIELSPVLAEQSLTTQSVEGVCNLIKSISGLSQEKLDEHCSIIKSQNLSGQVLRTCNLEELKPVLKMNFGDWEIFKNVVMALRSNEKKNKNVKFYIKDPNEGESETAPTVSHQKKSNHQSTCEKQITLEDAMISGLLSTLNEDAHEDILTGEILSLRGSSEDISNMSPCSSTNGADVETLSSSHRRSYNENEAQVIYLSHSSPHNISKRETHVDVERGIGSRSNRMLSSLPTWPSQGEMVGMTSVPTSPTADFPLSIPSVESIQPCFSRSKKASGSTRSSRRSVSEVEDNPYGWLSSTAPTSPSTRIKKDGSSKISKTAIIETLSRKLNPGSSAAGQVNPGKVSKQTCKHEIETPPKEETASESDEGSSSPEQDTVSKRPSLTCSRGPPLQEIFRGRDDKDTLTTVLPDGKNVTMEKSPMI